MRAWFPDDAARMDYLDWLRWPAGSVGRACGVVGEPRRMRGRVWHCSACEAKLSRTAGTVFQDTRSPLTTRFQAAWLMPTDKGGMSAKSLQRQLGIGSYQTAWTMLHRYRVAMGNSVADLLTGRVKVYETVYGGSRYGPPGSGALGKVLIDVAVELPIRGHAAPTLPRATCRALPPVTHDTPVLTRVSLPWTGRRLRHTQNSSPQR